MDAIYFFQFKSVIILGINLKQVEELAEGLHMNTCMNNLCMNTNQQSQSCHLSEPVIPVGREPGQAPVLLVEP